MEKICQQNLLIPVNGVALKCDLQLPPDATTIIIFVRTPGNASGLDLKMIARQQFNAGFGTLIIDLLSEEESQSIENQYDGFLLSFRLIRATEWLEDRLEKSYTLGYFATGICVGAALNAATALQQVGAVVGLNGKIEIPIDFFIDFHAATLLIVDSHDTEGISKNLYAFDHLKGKKSITILPKASSLFNENGVLNRVCKLTADWFENYEKPVVHAASGANFLSSGK